MYKAGAEYEMGLIYEQPPEPVHSNLLQYPNFFEMGATSREKLEESKNAQKRHRLSNFSPTPVVNNYYSNKQYK